MKPNNQLFLCLKYDLNIFFILWAISPLHDVTSSMYSRLSTFQASVVYLLKPDNTVNKSYAVI